jgi:hypothetical protein
VVVDSCILDVQVLVFFDADCRKIVAAVTQSRSRRDRMFGTNTQRWGFRGSEWQSKATMFVTNATRDTN